MNIQNLEEQHSAGTYPKRDLVLVRGSGVFFGRSRFRMENHAGPFRRSRAGFHGLHRGMLGFGIGFTYGMRPAALGSGFPYQACGRLISSTLYSPRTNVIDPKRARVS